MTVDVARADVETGAAEFYRRPMWLLTGQAGVFITLFIGSGATGGVRPKVLILYLAVCLAATVAVGPLGQIGRIVVTASLTGLVVWWIASYFWTTNVYGWWTDTQVHLPPLLALVAFAGLLPDREFRDALVAGSYAIVAYTLLEILINPDEATVNPDGVPGWRGEFIHKNVMGPVMLLAIVVLSSFATPSRRRSVAIGAAIALTLLSQSTTALAAGLVVAVVYVLVRRLASGSAPARASLVVGTLFVMVVGALLSSAVLPRLLGLRGKDATLSRRTDIWSRVWDAIDRQPLQGHGIGGVWRDPSSEPTRSILRNLGFFVVHAHNGFLEILLFLGVVGLLLFAWLTVSTLRYGFQLLKTDTPMAVFIACLVSLIVMLSISEVAVFGIWLALLGGTQAAIVRAARQTSS